ncbi:hypothetical protein [Dactylosporangium sp. NPDC005555]|uniref:hypothetical protein n=1 Tax=Dactylosporangium sp. NPDC005555 TaxID=3154889 RepID=UPI0033B5F276
MIFAVFLAVCLALVYTVLAVRQLYTLRDGDGDGPVAGAGRWRTGWLAARSGPMPQAVPADQRLARAESDAVHRLLRGELSRAGYVAAMAELAARDAAERPLDVPTTP